MIESHVVYLVLWILNESIYIEIKKTLIECMIVSTLLHTLFVDVSVVLIR